MKAKESTTTDGHYVEEGEVVDRKHTTNTVSATHTIYQYPNRPILIAMLAFLVSGPLSGFVGTVVYMAGVGALVYWSYLEITQGINGVRRFLGWLGVLLALNLVIHLLIG